MASVVSHAHEAATAHEPHHRHDEHEADEKPDQREDPPEAHIGAPHDPGPHIDDPPQLTGCTRCATAVCESEILVLKRSLDPLAIAGGAGRPPPGALLPRRGPPLVCQEVCKRGQAAAPSSASLRLPFTRAPL